MLCLVVALFAAQLQAVIIPGPPGPHAVSYEVHDLTDNTRQDPYAPSQNPHKRRIIASSYVPVAENQKCDRTQIPYMPPKSTTAYGSYAATLGLPNNTFDDIQLEYCQSSTKSPKRYPLIIFSPGLTASRLMHTVQSRALASYGFVVIAIDHPYDATFVEYPDGTTVKGTIPYNATDAQSDDATEVRAADVSFVINLFQGKAPGASLPKQLVDSVDLTKILAFGHSMGGATAIEAALLDNRVLGSLDFDGRPWGKTAKTGSDNPLVIVGSAANNASWPPFYEKFSGPRIQVSLEGSTHVSFLDMAMIFATRPLPDEYKAIADKVVGTVPGPRVQEISMGFLNGFAKLVLDGETGPLKTIDERFSEISVDEEDLNC